MAQTTRVFISGYYGFENAGDEAILCAIVAQFRAHDPRIRITAVSGNPALTAEMHGIAAVSWQDGQAIFDAISESDLTVVGGGGLFHDYWGFNPNFFLTNQQSGIAFFTAPAVLGALLGKPVALYAIGVGPLLSEHARRFTKVACEAATSITVRDEASGRILQSLGIAGDRIIVTADPVFGLAIEKTTAENDVVSEIWGEAKKPLVAVSVRDWDNGVDRDFWEREFAAALDQFLSRSGGTILFVPFGSLAGKRENDIDVSVRIQSQMRHRDSSIVVSRKLSQTELLRLLGNCDLTVGMRLHSLIFSALNHVPLVALSYDPKVDQAMARIGSRFVVDIRSLEAGVLSDAMSSALAEAPEFRAGISDKLQSLAALAEKNAAIALEGARSNHRAAGYWPAGELSSLLVRGIRAQLLACRTLQFELHELTGVLARVEADRDESRTFLLHENQVLTKRVEEVSEVDSRRAVQCGLLEAELQKSSQFQLTQNEAIQAIEADRAELRAELEKARGFQLEQAESLRLSEADRLKLRAELEKAQRFQQEQTESIARLDADRAVLRTEILDLRRLESDAAAAIAAAENDRKNLREGLSVEQHLRQTADESLARLDAANAVLSRQLEAALAKAHRVETDRQTISDLLMSAEERLRGVQEKLKAEKEVLRNSRSQLTMTQSHLRDSLVAHRNTARAIKEFESRFEQDLNVFRSQRAWKIMLYFRQAYTMLIRQGPRGWSRFAGWTLAVPFTGSGLDEQELRFPDISHYLPAPYREPSVSLARTDHSSAIAVSDIGESAQKNQYDIVILGIIDFDFRFQRPQQMAAQFARAGHRVFWISPSRFLPPASETPYRIVELRENIREVQLRGPQPDVYMGRLEPRAARALAASLEILFRDYTIAENAMILQLPFWRQIGLMLREQFSSVVAYDCMDDWETFENMGQFNVLEEKPLATECDVLIVTGQGLLEKFAARGIEPVLARNGADFDFFVKARPSGLLAEIPRPVIGYFGAIADWIDLDLVRDVARLRPQYSFVLIGQVFGRDMSELEALPNVHLMGNQKYELIPVFLTEFDVCTIPFLLNQVTKATDPVKIYEYLSQGKPVIATDMAELAQCRDLIYIGNSSEDFANKIDAALSESDSGLKARRIAFARQNTWANRVDAIDARIRQKFPLVSILIVTYNSAEFILPCLESIFSHTAYPHFELIIVDNASTDGTADLVRDYLARKSDTKIKIELESLDVNRGFSAGNNAAARKAHGELLIFLNADTMVTSGWIERLRRHILHDASIGIICPVTNFAGNEIKINVDYTNSREMQEFALRIASEKQFTRMDIDVAPLYCAMVPRKVWLESGGLDEEYGVGMFEDDDFCRRVRREGYRVMVAEDCFIHHFGQGSFAKISPAAYQSLFDTNRGRFEAKWNTVWKPHKTRSGVRPAFDEVKFSPREFVVPTGQDD